MDDDIGGFEGRRIRGSCPPIVKRKGQRGQSAHAARHLGCADQLKQGRRIQLLKMDGGVADDIGFVIEHKLAGQAWQKKKGCQERSHHAKEEEPAFVSGHTYPSLKVTEQRTGLQGATAVEGPVCSVQ
jgi:hypothetical protein